MDDPPEVSLLVDAAEAARLCSVSRSTFLRLDRAGLIGPRSIKLGKLRRWDRRALERWIEAACPAREAWLRMNCAAYGPGANTPRTRAGMAPLGATTGLQVGGGRP
jgi:excisionase family DNA binding protein